MREFKASADKYYCPNCGSGHIQILRTGEDTELWECKKCGTSFEIENEYEEG